MNRHEAERIAHAINAYRPSWPVASLVTFIGRHHQHRPERDVLIALAWVAADPATTSPGRINEAGPWWEAAEAEVRAGNRARPWVREVCTDHGLGLPCRECGATEPRRPEGTERVAEYASAARAAVRPTKTRPAHQEDQ